MVGASSVIGIFWATLARTRAGRREMLARVSLWHVQLAWVVLSAVLAIFAVAGAGALARRLDWLTEDADRSLLDTTVRLLTPCLNLSVTMSSAALRRPENLHWPPLLGVATAALGFALAWLLTCSGRGLTDLATATEKRTFSFAAGTFNYGYIPIPLVSLLFPKDGTLGVLMVYMLGVDLAFWTLGVIILTGGHGGAWWRKLLNPPSLATVAGVTLNLTGLARHVPPFLSDAITMVGAAAVPLGIILVGAMTADHLGETQWRAGMAPVVCACLLRALLAPAAVIALAWLLPVSVELKRVLVVEAAMPAAMFAIVVTRYYKGDGALAVRIVVATSLVALVTVPLWLSAGMAFLGLH
jgi:predicted permease